MKKLLGKVVTLSWVDTKATAKGILVRFTPRMGGRYYVATFKGELLGVDSVTQLKRA